MSKLGELLAWKLNQVFPTLAIHRELQTAKQDISANQRWAYREAARIVPAFEPYWKLAGLNILDIGTGLGGKLPFYIDCGAVSVTGIDLNPQSLRIASMHIHELGLADKVSLLRCDAAKLPFPDDHFEAIVSINVFEHIARLEEAVRETYRVLKPGGLVFLHLPPYYSPWGPHLENWIHYPWPHLLFSDQTLLRVAAREDAKRGLNDQFVQAARIDWEASGGRIPDVNRVTLRRFRQMVRQAGFTIKQLKLLPVGYDAFQTSNASFRRAGIQLLNLGAQLPLLQEVLVTKMVYVLSKKA